MDNKHRWDLAGWVAERARQAGAGDVAVNLGVSREVEVSHRDGKVENLKESAQNTLQLEIYASGRYSAHATNDLRRQTLEKFIASAVAMTRYLTEDPYRRLPDPSLYQGRSDADLQIHDPAIATLTIEERLRRVREAEAAARAVSDRIISATASTSDAQQENLKLHSNGFSGEQREAYCTLAVEATVDDRHGGRPEDFAYAVTRRLADLPAAAAVGEEAARRALAKIGQVKISTGTYDLLVENRAAGRLISAVLGPMSARSVQQKNSCLDGKLGKKIASEKLTAADDPFISGGLGSRLFDSEGISARKRTMIEAGVLKQFYIDNYYGRKLGWKPTGGSLSNLGFSLGLRPLSDMIREVKKGVWIENFIGGNSNATTGDFSFGLMGFEIVDGALARPVNEMNLTGNLESFWNRLVELGSDAFAYSPVRVPSLWFKEIELSGL